MAILRLYRQPGLSQGTTKEKLRQLQTISPSLEGLSTELCFNVQVEGQLSTEKLKQLQWILGSPLHPEGLQKVSFLLQSSSTLLIEIGPRLNFSTAFSTNAVSICESVGLTQVSRIEMSTRYLLEWNKPESRQVTKELEGKLVSALHDRMTQCRYAKPIVSFDLGIVPEPWYEVDIVNEGRRALEKVNDHLGLAFDDWDLDYYTDLFKNKLNRNPTSVECFDLAQSNSEHSRHWFFKGKIIIDGKEESKSLIDLVMDTQNTTNPNNVIKFSDNSSAIEGYMLNNLWPGNSQEPSAFTVKKKKRDIIFTAETHNFPTGVAPFSGATTGTGGRLRDVHAVGRGGHYIAGTAGYSVGNLLIPGYELPWEDGSLTYPSNFAPPSEIIVEASNGASDYGNKFGEPIISGFARSFGMVVPGDERREWVKPIMFSGGIGALDSNMVDKLQPEKGMKVVKLGGPVYRIGVGGGSASSVQVQGDNKSELDFGAVQRGDAEMEQKLHRVIRACLEMGDGNPICSIHDQGAGGNGNVLKELVEPTGAVIFTKKFKLGDPTLNTLELWGAEYQESDALLCQKDDVDTLQGIADREKCPVCFVGTVTGDGKIILSEEDACDDEKYLNGSYRKENARHPVNLELELVLGKMPRKSFSYSRTTLLLKELSLPSGVKVREALERVLRLPSVASKRYLTNKVDRSVTGLVAQQQCVGPLHTPLADVAVTALSYFDTVGSATAIGEQPIKGLLDAAAGARMTLAESITNLVFAVISDIQDIKCSGNWMWAAKLPGEGALLYDACRAMCEAMAELGVAVDGGKDSLSMAARVEGKTVKAPGTLVISTYAPCPDVRRKVTPDLKCPGMAKKGDLLMVDLSGSRSRTGGSALAQCFKQLGSQVPDLDDAKLLKQAFVVTQKLIKENKILSGHDISDGGLVTCILEMAFGGNCGLNVNIKHKNGQPMDILFAEELGWVLEVEKSNTEYVTSVFSTSKVPCYLIGESNGYGPQSSIQISVNGSVEVEDTLLPLLLSWEETSYRLEQRQANLECIRQENEGFSSRLGPNYTMSFDPQSPPVISRLLGSDSTPCVAVLREEGINGDREMVAALYIAGFQVWDVTMNDLLTKKVTVDRFQGVIFPGGFSYADVLGSAKGWAASLLFDPSLQAQFRAFSERSNTFSLGVCNGCQLMGLLGWIGTGKGALQSSNNNGPVPEIMLDHNISERFESRFSTVRIERSPSIMLQGMEGSVLGVWVAHGEGQFTFKNKDIYSSLKKNGCLALHYVDDNGQPTEVYPMNPNGSIGGLAGVCSLDGRHLAMMPHPERCVLPWQWPWMSEEWKRTVTTSPWLRMFQNAYCWCIDIA